ncbi:MAG: magnesium transporter [Deltaproteobacteria bacterium RIFCSPHIGHO2_02_FULL_40_11]|nr:MAG: magnesium transporter [Deltaproteobacteria bacterium RIFCSPHIGHO2_02_FULL_40_11]
MNHRSIQIFQDTVLRLLHRGAQSNLQKIIEKSHFADIAQVLHLIDQPRDKKAIFHLASLQKKAQVLEKLSTEDAISLIEDLDFKEIVQIFQKMSSHEVTDIIGGLPEDISKELLKLMDTKGSEEIEELLKYHEDSAGGIMSTEFCALDKETTVGETIQKFHTEVELDNIFYVYVVNREGQLVGVLSLRKLLQVKPETKIEDIMISNVIRVKTDADQEEVAKMVQRYNLLALPVVDENNKLMGIITVDDIVDVIRKEAEEDILKMGGAGDVEVTERSALKSARSRLPWLFISLLAGIVAFKILVVFEKTLSSAIALTFFIPLVMGLTGNVATQASTIVVSGLAHGKIQLKDLFSILWKELKVGALFGLIYGVIVGAYANIQYGASLHYLGLVVGGALGISMALAALIGSVLPLLFERTHIDPALSTGPFVISVVDVFSVFIFMYLAHLLYAV